MPTSPRQVGTCEIPAPCPSDSRRHESAKICEDNRQIPSLESRKGGAISANHASRDLLTTSLPLEIVGQIFEEYVTLHPRNSTLLLQQPHSHQQGASGHFLSFSPRALLNLGAVCQLWRNTAWSHPPLWNNLYIDLSSTGYEHGPDIVEEWLARSGALPLDIRISDGDDINSRSEGQHAITIMNMIRQFSPRWRSLDIRMEHSAMMYNLEDSYSSNDQNAPSTSLLRHLSLVGGSYVLPFEKLLYPIHWTHLSHLHVKETHVRSLRWMLERISEKSSPLTHMCVEQIWGAEEDPIVPEWMLLSQPIIPLPTLLSFSLGPPAIETLFMEVFDHLHAAALRSFECDLTGRSCFASFMAFTARSGFSLKELVLTELDEMPIEFILCLLKEFPFLMDLTLLTNTHAGSAAIAAVSEALSEQNFRATSAPILPRLKRLHIGVSESVLWSPVVGIYIRDPFFIRHPMDSDQIQPPNIPRPGRDSLKLSVCQQVRHGQSPLVDVNTLVAFAYLWQQHGVCILVRERGRMFQEKDLLVWSYLQSPYYKETQYDDAILTSLKKLAAITL